MIYWFLTRNSSELDRDAQSPTAFFPIHCDIGILSLLPQRLSASYRSFHQLHLPWRLQCARKPAFHWVLPLQGTATQNQQGESPCKVKIIVHIRSINCVLPSSFPCCNYFISILPRAPMGSHSSTVSHDMSTHLEVIQSDLLGVLDQLPFPLHSREENQMALTLQGQIR